MTPYNLSPLHKKISACSACAARDCRFRPTLTHIGSDDRVLILGESPAKNGWRTSGRAWYKPNGEITASGKVLKKLLAQIGIVLEDLFFTEAAKCTPANAKRVKECVEKCRPFLAEQLKIIRPRVIVPLGVHATKSLLSAPFKRFADVVGRAHATEFGIVIPIYHPSPISPAGYKKNVPIMGVILENISKAGG